MSQPIIKSRTNPLVQKIRSVRDGKDKTLFFCEGIKLVKELLVSRFKTSQIVSVPEYAAEIKTHLESLNKTHVPVAIVDANVMEAMSDLDAPPGVIALGQRESKADVEERGIHGDLFLILPKTQLPQNLGAMMRSGEAAGVSEIWLGTGSADPFSPKCIRGSSGSVFRIFTRRGLPLKESLDKLKAHGVQILAATQNGNKRYDQVDWKKPTALVLGEEGSGFSQDQLHLVDETIQIPMKGQVESLNLGTAAAVCLFEAVRQRQR